MVRLLPVVLAVPLLLAGFLALQAIGLELVIPAIPLVLMLFAFYLYQQYKEGRKGLPFYLLVGVGALLLALFLLVIS